MNPMTEPKKSSTDLIKLRHVETEPLRVGLKRTHVDGTEDETRELRDAYERLRAQLSVPRIERLSGRALATWDVEQQAAQVQRKNGKFEHFGYSDNGKEYLEYYEALFLLELGRLQLEYYGMIVSVEQAYLLLLGEAATQRHNEYIVYSNLSRVGYIVTKHRNVSYEPEKPVTTTDCIWALLQHNLDQKPLPDNVQSAPFFAKIKASMDAVKTRIMQPESNTTEDVESIPFKYQLHKRKATELASTSKKPRWEQTRNATTTNGGSLVDLLKNEPEYEMFKHIFEKFSFIELENYEFNDMDDCQDLRISFDLHLHNNAFRKSTPKPPTFSVIIISAEEPFPKHKDIANCQRQLLKKTPLLLLTVSESKQIQAFLYYIS